MTSGRRSNVYLKWLTEYAAKVLGLLDRQEFSRTYGCLDRTYWAWKFTDFPGARFQEGLCYLGFLYATDFDGNDYYRNERLRSWIAGGFDFWVQIQRRSGDFDEAYPFERSLAATAFTSFYLSEAWHFMGSELSTATADRFRAALTRAGDWLARNDERHGFLSNHLAAAAVALYHAYRITGEDRFEKRSRYFIDKILGHQSSEGWYEEYGAADPGYQTHGSFYLARYRELSGDEELVKSLDRSFEFLSHFVHPDLSLGGEYASRNTQTYYPAAFELMAPESVAAARIAATMLPAVESLSAAGLGSVDIYNLFPLLNNYVFAYLAASRSTAEEFQLPIPVELPEVIHFPEAGLLRVCKSGYELYVGLKKGGVLKLFDKRQNRLVFSSCGYIGTLRNGKVFSSQCWDEERHIELTQKKVKISGGFCKVSRPLMAPWKFLLFRIFSLTLGRFPTAAYWLKTTLVKALIYRSQAINVRLERQISFQDDGIEVLDYIQGNVGTEITHLVHSNLFTTIHMGSSRYFVPNELIAPPKDQGSFISPIDPALVAGGVSRQIRVCVR